jgi:uncharacterized membrane protein
MTEEAALQAVVAAFKTRDGASTALEELKLGLDAFALKEAAVLVRVGKGALLGGVTGAVVGLITGPVGWVVVGGATIGALANKLRDTGFPDARLKQIGQALTPGTSALIAIVRQDWAVEVEEHLRAAGADLTTEAMRSDVAVELEKSAEAGA